MAYKIAKLRAMSDEDLIALYDREAPSATANINYFLAELDRREIRRRTDTMVRRTWAIFALTVVVAVSTLLLLVRATAPRASWAICVIDDLHKRALEVKQSWQP